MKKYSLNKVEEAISSIKKGEIIIVVDDENRENEGDFIAAGSIKNPIFRGGGRIFGPKPRDYNQKLNKKVKRAILLK